MTESRHRIATRDDATEIFAVLKEVASKIPCRVDGDDRVRLLMKSIGECCDSQLSLVATDTTGRVVGFLLAHSIYDGASEPVGINLPYGGVRPAWQGQRIFATMLTKMKQHKMPLFAAVLHENESQMAERLAKLGFDNIGTDTNFPNRDNFRWMPSAPC